MNFSVNFPKYSSRGFLSGKPVKRICMQNSKEKNAKEICGFELPWDQKNLLFNLKKMLLTISNVLPVKLCKYDNEYIRSIRKATLSSMKKATPTCNLNSPQRQKLRNDIIEDFFKSQKDINKSGNFYLVMGPPGAGKTTFSQLLARAKKICFLDSDTIKTRIPEFKINPKLDYIVCDEASRICEKIFDSAIEKNYDVILENTGTHKSELLNFIEKAKSHNYKIHLRFITVSLDTAVQRSLERFEKTKRFVDPFLLCLRKNGIYKNYEKLIKSEYNFDSYALYSNEVPSSQKPRLIAERSTFDKNELK